MTKKIGVLVGSLRKESFNRKMAKQLISLAPSSLSFEFIDIGNLPFYNEDLENDSKTLPEWAAFRDKITACDALLFCTPEYNRSVPAVLKNAIDVGSRPYGRSVWSKKPAAIVSVSLGVVGGFGANHHLRQSFVFLDIPCMPQPEAYIGQANNLFDGNGNITNEGTQKFLQDYMQNFAKWVDKLL